MPWSLKRFHQSRQLHFVTFICYRRRPLLDTPARRVLFERALEDRRRSYRFFVTGYVVMPEHVHLLVSEPERRWLATAIQALKQTVARRLALRDPDPFWQARYYDFKVWSERKRIDRTRGPSRRTCFSQSVPAAKSKKTQDPSTPRPPDPQKKRGSEKTNAGASLRMTIPIHE